MTRHDVLHNHKRRISAEGFVDDIALFINHRLLTDDNLILLYECTHHDINAWQQLLASSGGKLELTKCFYYVLLWKFNKFGDPIPKTIEDIHQEVCNRVQIEDPDTKQIITMEQKDIHQVHKTLGVLKSISGDDSEQIQALLTKSNKLATQTKLGQLTRYQARRAYTSIYMPSMTYSLVATSLSESSLHDVQSKALRAFLPAMGYEPTFPRAIVHGPRNFGGLNIGHLYTEMQVAKVGALVAHIQAQSGLGDIMLKNINWLQLHSGLLHPVLQYPQPIQYIPFNWFLHLKEFLYSIRGTLIIPGQWVPQLEQLHDQATMEVVLANESMTNAERRIFNNWRIYFKVSTISDLVEPDGTRIQLGYWRPPSEDTQVNREIRQSRHNWPRQQQPHVSTFRIWRKGLRTLCGTNSGGELLRPLGDWVTTFRTSSNDWNDYLDPNTRLVYRRQTDQTFWVYIPARDTANRTIYSALPEDSVTTIPDVCIPVQVMVTSPTSMLVNHKQFCGPISSRPPRICSFDDHLTTLPQWRSDLLLHWSTIPLAELERLYHNTSVVRIASDGSYNQATTYGAFGAVIGTDEHILMQVRGHAPGHNDLKSSFRSELYGVLASLVLLMEVQSYCGWATLNSKTLHLYVDNKSVVDRLNRHRSNTFHLGEMVAADMDVEFQILEEIRQLESRGFRFMPIQHIKAHQDKDKCFEDLSWEAQLNVTADALATSMSQQSYYNIPYSIFPTTKIQLRLDDQAITSNYKECLRTAYLTQDMHEYYQQKFNWESSVVDDIWWDTFGNTIKRLSHTDRQKIQKFHIRRLPSNKRRHLLCSSASEFCMHCPLHTETNDHILQCGNCSAERLQLKDDWILKLFDYLSEDHTPNSVRTTIIVALNSWLNNAPIPPISAIVPDASTELIKAYQSQTQIGWDNLIKGRLSIYWSEIIADHIRRADISSKTMTSDRWAVTLVSELWQGVLTLWDSRNKEMYGQDRETQTTKLKQYLIQEARYLLSQRDMLPLETVPWFQKPLEELSQYSVISLKAWIRNARTIVRLYYKERRASDLDHVQGQDDNLVTGLQRTHIENRRITMGR